MPGWCMGAWRGQGGRVVAGRGCQERPWALRFEFAAATSRGEVMGLPATASHSLAFSQAMQHFEGKKCGGHFRAAGASGKGQAKFTLPYAPAHGDNRAKQADIRQL